MLVLSESTSIKIRPTVGSFWRMLFSIRSIASSSFLHIQTTAKSDVHIHEDLFRSELHRQDFAYILHRRIVADDLSHSSNDCAIRSLTHQ
jgi:hypothetical protein